MFENSVKKGLTFGEFMCIYIMMILYRYTEGNF